MSEENCSQDCDSCGETCASGKNAPADFLEKPNSLSKIGRVIGVISGKGGVGKSFITSLLAVLLNRRGYRTAILDADITGPSIPKLFGITQRAAGNDSGIFPAETRTGIKVMSVNLLLADADTPVVWRGPLIANAAKQFWTDVIWGDVEYLFVDLPPGTGDVPLTVFQSVPLDGIIVVTTPQELVSMIVSKAVSMANMMKIPVIGIVENMSYVKCPDCGKEIKVFGESHAQRTAEKFSLKLLGRCPLEPEAARKCDAGLAEEIDAPWLGLAADTVEHFPKKSV